LTALRIDKGLPDCLRFVLESSMKNFDELAGAGWPVLTPREREVVYPVAEGKSNKLIAMELGISMRTVEAHRARIFYKMGVRNAVQLARTVYSQPETVVDELNNEPTDNASSVVRCNVTVKNKNGLIESDIDTGQLPQPFIWSR
jgi:DNA-binding CsgD family transcriptional regulator